MREKFIITVTNNIEGCPIVKYLDPICSNVVIGTNIFSDIVALPHSIKKNKFFLNIHSLRFCFFSRLSSAFFLFAR